MNIFTRQGLTITLRCLSSLCPSQ